MASCEGSPARAQGEILRAVWLGSESAAHVPWVVICKTLGKMVSWAVHPVAAVKKSSAMAPKPRWQLGLGHGCAVHKACRWCMELG